MLTKLVCLRKTEAEVRAYIAKDLDEAIPDLEANVTRGRLGKGAALAIRMREALYYGDWEVAKAKAKEIIDLNVYSLEPATRSSSPSMVKAQLRSSLLCSTSRR